MLGYFETKNIGRKRERAAAFHEMGDTTSEIDMEFDWADETLHAEYGRRWLRRLLEARGEDPESWPAVLERCEELVQQRVAHATPGGFGADPRLRGRAGSRRAATAGRSRSARETSYLVEDGVEGSRIRRSLPGECGNTRTREELRE